MQRFPVTQFFPRSPEALFSWLAHFHVNLVRKPGLENLTIKEHRDILAAITDGDVNRAGKAMADHLNRANALYHRDKDRKAD